HLRAIFSATRRSSPGSQCERRPARRVSASFPAGEQVSLPLAPYIRKSINRGRVHAGSRPPLLGFASRLNAPTTSSILYPLSSILHPPFSLPRAAPDNPNLSRSGNKTHRI